MPDGAKPGGLFTLIFRKFPEGWKIVHDHTSAEEAPSPTNAYRGSRRLAATDDYSRVTADSSRRRRTPSGPRFIFGNRQSE